MDTVKTKKSKLMKQPPALLICPETGNDIIVNFETITPLQANRLLSSNHENNRNIKVSVVNTYAEQMKNGQWHPSSAEAIKISDKGVLIDGQHRLHAVIKADEAATFMTVRGVPSCAFTAIDDGVVRTLPDALMISGVQIKGGAQRAGKAIQILLMVENSISNEVKLRTVPRRKPSLTKALSFHKNLKGFNQSIAKFTDLYNYSSIQRNFNTPALMALFYMFNGIDEATDEALHSVCISLEMGTPFDDFKNKSPVHHVIDFVRRSREQNTILRFYQYFDMFIWALDKTLQKEPVDSIPKNIDFDNYKLEAKRLAMKRITPC